MIQLKLKSEFMDKDFKSGQNLKKEALSIALASNNIKIIKYLKKKYIFKFHHMEDIIKYKEMDKN